MHLLTSISRFCRVRQLGSFLSLLFLLTLILLSLTTGSRNVEAQSFADSAFSGLWKLTDGPIANGSSNSSWLWGAIPLNSRTELYQESPAGQRLVQYFDKGRLEINNINADRRSNNFVTSGLLCSELVSGQMQVGDNRYETRSPAQIPVGGDLNSPVGPTYATFSRFASLNGGERAPVKNGFVTDSIDRAGQTGTTQDFSQLTSYAFYDDKLGHNVADVFVNWMNGLSSRQISWQYLVGLPITEPYWATFRINGEDREILVQLFERRALTYNPLNDSHWQIEMGNIGLHYWTWRYNTGLSSVNTQAGWDGEETRFLQLINGYRQSARLTPLQSNLSLTTVARWMSQDMADKAYFSHTDSLGRDPFKRMFQLGYTANTWRGENLAGGFEGAEATMVAWKNSPGHNQNMLNPNFRSIGISRIYNPNSPYQWYWSTEFGQ